MLRVVSLFKIICFRFAVSWQVWYRIFQMNKNILLKPEKKLVYHRELPKTVLNKQIHPGPSSQSTVLTEVVLWSEALRSQFSKGIYFSLFDICETPCFISQHIPWLLVWGQKKCCLLDIYSPLPLQILHAYTHTHKHTPEFINSVG